MIVLKDQNDTQLITQQGNYIRQELFDELEKKLEEQTKTYKKILQEQQNDIDQLERNCDVFNEQMNDAAEITAKLKQDKEDLKNKLDIANKKLDEIKEYADDKREEFNDVIRYYLDDNLIGNEDEVNKLREFRSWFMEILSIIGGE